MKTLFDGAAYVFSLVQEAEAGGEGHFSHELLDQEVDLFPEFEWCGFSAVLMQALFKKLDSC